MATSEEIEKYCRNCVSRDFVNGKGLVCKRTRELPAFEEECESFETVSYTHLTLPTILLV